MAFEVNIVFYINELVTFYLIVFITIIKYTKLMLQYIVSSLLQTVPLIYSLGKGIYPF